MSVFLFCLELFLFFVFFEVLYERFPAPKAEEQLAAFTPDKGERVFRRWDGGVCGCLPVQHSGGAGDAKTREVSETCPQGGFVSIVFVAR